MKHKKTLLCSLLLISCLILVTSMPVFAAELTEAEVQQAVDAQGKETVTGNVFIWFLCAIAFLKVSQKIDSFMASLGVNVGNTGGNMMAELLIAGRGLASSFRGHGGGSHSSSHSSSPGSAAVQSLLWSSIFVTLMANKIGGLQFGIYRNCQISSRVFHTAVAALPLTKANRSDFE